MEEVVSNLFSFGMLFKLASIVFSLVFVLISVQMYLNVQKISKTVATVRNWGFQLGSLLIVIFSLLLLLASIVLL